MSIATTDAIGPSTTVNEVLQVLPEASGLLSDLGLDTCCGGGLSLQEACGDAGLDLASVLGRLQKLEDGGA